jgi:hypothetical protein
MTKALVFAYWQQLLFAFRLLRAIPVSKPQHLLIRVLLFPILWCATLLLLISHSLAFVCDECFFSSYRRIAIKRPLFILGVPRSGTTWLQRVLANDTSLTTLTLAEALFMPSITQRLIFRSIKRVFKPFALTFQKLKFNPLTAMDAIHKIRLDEPEEDFLLFIPLHACFLLALVCPRSKHYWNLSRFDTDLPETHRQTILNYYHRCLQKHLYVHGHTLTVLSKNPSFTPLLSSLRAQFPDARVVACTRNPREVIPSQLNSVSPLQKLIGIGMPDAEFNAAMLELLCLYYERINADRAELAVVDMQELNAELEQCVRKLYERFDMLLLESFAERLKVLDAKGKQYQSQHSYHLEKFNLTNEAVEKQFGDLWPLPSE